MPEKFDQLANPAEALAAHRRASAITAERQALAAELDLAAGEKLRDLAPDEPAKVGAVLEDAGHNATEARGRALALRDLAGLTDADYPLAGWEAASAPGRPAPPGGSFRDELGQWEELAVQRADQAEHPEAYGVDRDAAAFDVAVAEARVLALRDLLAKLGERAAAAAASRPNRAARRSSGE